MTVDKVFIPSSLPRATSLVATNFPSIRVEEYEDTSLIANANEPGRGSSVQFEDKNPVIAGRGSDKFIYLLFNRSRHFSRQYGIPMALLGYYTKNAES